MPKVAIIQRVLTKYRMPFYQKLKQRLESDRIDLEFIHGLGDGFDQSIGYLDCLPWAKAVREKYIKIGKFSLIYQPYSRLLAGADLIIVQQEMKWLLNYFLIAKRRFSNYKLAFWGHGLNRQLPVTAFENRIKAKLVNCVDWWFAYTQRIADDVMATGFPKEKITIVDNAIDTDALIKAKSHVSKAELDSFKEELGLRSKNVGLFCGGMHPHKRIGFLLDACLLIKNRIPDFQMIFVGDGPDCRMVEEARKQHDWIIAPGPLYSRNKVLCFLLSDLVLMPGLVGLVVLDSFVFEKPLVTTVYPFHSPEIEYLINGENGFITENDVGKYAREVIRLFQNKDQLGSIRDRCRIAAAKYTMENMVDNFIGGIKRCLG